MKNKTTLIIGGVIVFIILFAIIGGDGLNNNPAQTTSSNNQYSLCGDIASLKNQDITVNFKELDKNPDSFNGKIVKFTGQVVQIQEDNNYGIIRLAVTKESYGWSISDIIWVEYQNHTDAVKDDVITVYGQLTGSKTYESQAHFNITVPSIMACAVEKDTGITQSQPTSKPATQKTTSDGQTETQSTQQPVTSTTPPPTTTQAPTPAYSRVDGLSAIRIGGGIIWENWDSDLEKDGPVIDIVYLNSQGEIISSDATRKMQISADVKAYAKGKDEMKTSSSASKLVFSAHYTKEQIIFGGIYPKIRIPKEQINVDTSVDSNKGAVEVVIHTPEQGDFGDKQGWFVLYPY